MRTKIVAEFDGTPVNYLAKTEPNKKDVTMGEGTYALGNNKKGDIVFKYPEKAMVKIEKDCYECLEEYIFRDFLPENATFKECWRRALHSRPDEEMLAYETEIVREQYKMVKDFLKYYSNLYDSKDREDRKEDGQDSFTNSRRGA